MAQPQYVYCPESATFVEVEPERGRWIRWVGGAFLVALALSLAVLWHLDQKLDTPQAIALRAQNASLQQQLIAVQQQLVSYSGQLDQLNDKDQAMYQTLLGAMPLSMDIRQVGIGGSDPYADFDGFSAESADLLAGTSHQVDRLMRQIQLQQTRLHELEDLATTQRVEMQEMPAIRPTDGRIVSFYGNRLHPVYKKYRMHHGIDFIVPRGTAVHSTGDGFVKRSGYDRGYGYFIEIEHPVAGYRTRYAHLKSIDDHIKKGAPVQRGERIGLSGNTGVSTGPHLHYEVRTLEGQSLNPIYFLIGQITPEQYQVLLAEAEKEPLVLD